LEELLERIRRRDRKLTVIYGSSGVGKSSILQAGLVPILQQTYFEGRDVVPVLLQVYQDWVGGLEKGLVEALESVNRSSSFAKESLDTQSDPPLPPLKRLTGVGFLFYGWDKTRRTRKESRQGGKTVQN
jgi:hypothetical protein